MAKNRSLEHDEQVTLINWADSMPLHGAPADSIGAYLYAIPNGARVAMGTAKKLKAEGLRAGVPDLCLALPSADYHGLYIELKKQRQHYDGMAAAARAVSPDQRVWHSRLERCGYRVEVCYGWEEARDVILDYVRTILKFVHGGQN